MIFLQIHIKKNCISSSFVEKWTKSKIPEYPLWHAEIIISISMVMQQNMPIIWFKFSIQSILLSQFGMWIVFSYSPISLIELEWSDTNLLGIVMLAVGWYCMQSIHSVVWKWNSGKRQPIDDWNGEIHLNVSHSHKQCALLKILLQYLI